MKQLLSLFFFSFFFFPSGAQQKIREKKYPSLLWEISGNGLKKSSYLIGTMHVSSKLAFNLPDSFYIAVQHSQVVALETNPETWQADMSKYDVGSNNYSSGWTAMPNEYLRLNTLKFFKYDAKIERALYSNPSTINNLLYRSYGNESSDFEEDTYLDMYIYQCGKKWGKQVAGVEDYGKSMKLMAEAYQDAAKDEDKKVRSYGDMDDQYSSDKLQEAYRSGNLDLLDSINRYNSFSEAFDEKFLYRRNEIQAASIDSIIKSGATLFVGVGAAHLPGERGVIELLRKAGYQLRPVKMGERASGQKDKVDKIRVPVTFNTQTAADGFYKVNIPGTFYKFGEDAALDQQQYADMANGSYYMVTRIMTNAWLWGNSTDVVYKKVDSLLYENIPGKILSKKSILKNGYKGFDIVNRTRRGDVQRYNIFITPFEIIFFKMSGTGNYVNEGDEANRFFNSITLTANPENSEWKQFSPPGGGFTVKLPQQPYIGNDGSWIYDALDKNNKTCFRIIRTDIHNYHFAEADSFDLRLMEESFMASTFIGEQLSRLPGNFNGYPSLDGKYKGKYGGIFLAKFIIQGPHYYTLVAYGKQESAQMKDFFNSFRLTAFTYGEPKEQTDTTLYFSVKSAVYPDDKKIKLDVPRGDYSKNPDNDGEKSEKDLLEAGVFRSRIVKNDTTGEKIYVTFFHAPAYYYTKDSSVLDKENQDAFLGDTSWIVKSKSKKELPGNMKVWENVLTDTASSRSIWRKTYYKNGIGFSLTTETDTLSAPSGFVKTFYETFTPADTLKGINPFVKKSSLFFKDFANSDSLRHKRAISYISNIELDSTDLPELTRAIESLNWKEKNYLAIKKSLITKLGEIGTTASANYLKGLYFSLNDTVQLQYPVLENLLQQKTAAAFNTFSEIINNDPPVLDIKTNDYSYTSADLPGLYRQSYSGDDGKFLDEMSDSLQLAKTILPDLLPLLNLDDYKKPIMQLLGQMIDSQLAKPADYEMYYSKFLVEAKQELKKQKIAEKRKAIELAEKNKKGDKSSSDAEDDVEDGWGNKDLGLYTTLLLPFWDSRPAVRPLIQQMLTSSDKQLKYNSMLLMIKNNKPYPDSLLKYFADMDGYRYQLYKDLKEIKKENKFPALYNNHLDLARSKLYTLQFYDKPDSIIFVDRLHTTYLGKNGYIYFFKYKMKKDDLGWKLAMAGLIPENPGVFEFDDEQNKSTSQILFSWAGYYNKYDLSKFSDIKFNNDLNADSQLQLELKKILYSSRKSGEKFYDDSDRQYGDSSSFN